MRFKKISSTVWAWISHLADNSITATKDGLQINGDITIPWVEIDEARALATSTTKTIQTYETPCPVPQMSEERKAELVKQWDIQAAEISEFMKDKPYGVKHSIAETEELVNDIIALENHRKSDPLGIYLNDGTHNTIAVHWVK